MMIELSVRRLSMSMTLQTYLTTFGVQEVERRQLSPLMNDWFQQKLLALTWRLCQTKHTTLIAMNFSSTFIFSLTDNTTDFAIGSRIKLRLHNIGWSMTGKIMNERKRNFYALLALDPDKTPCDSQTVPVYLTDNIKSSTHFWNHPRSKI